MLSNLAGVLQTRMDGQRHPEDLDEAVDAARAAVTVGWTTIRTAARS